MGNFLFLRRPGILCIPLLILGCSGGNEPQGLSEITTKGSSVMSTETETQKSDIPTSTQLPEEIKKDLMILADVEPTDVFPVSVKDIRFKLDEVEFINIKVVSFNLDPDGSEEDLDSIRVYKGFWGEFQLRDATRSGKIKLGEYTFYVAPGSLVLGLFTRDGIVIGTINGTPQSNTGQSRQDLINALDSIAPQNTEPQKIDLFEDNSTSIGPEKLRIGEAPPPVKSGNQASPEDSSRVSPSSIPATLTPHSKGQRERVRIEKSHIVGVDPCPHLLQPIEVKGDDESLKVGLPLRVKAREGEYHPASGLIQLPVPLPGTIYPKIALTLQPFFNCKDLTPGKKHQEFWVELAEMTPGTKTQEWKAKYIGNVDVSVNVVALPSLTSTPVQPSTPAPTTSPSSIQPPPAPTPDPGIQFIATPESKFWVERHNPSYTYTGTDYSDTLPRLPCEEIPVCEVFFENLHTKNILFAFVLDSEPPVPATMNPFHIKLGSTEVNSVLLSSVGQTSVKIFYDCSNIISRKYYLKLQINQSTQKYIPSKDNFGDKYSKDYVLTCHPFEVQTIQCRY